MGEIADLNDIERIMRSSEGKALLEETRQMLEGRTIREITFKNEVHFIATVLHLDNGAIFLLAQPSLHLDMLRQEFKDVLEREHFVDFPDRKPRPAP